MELFELGGVTIGCPEEIGTSRITAKLRSGKYEGAEARAVGMRVVAGDRVLELGAGLGYIGALCARLAGAEGVTCVEANPVMLPVIRANLDRNGGGAVRLMHGAVVAPRYKAETVPFVQEPQFWSGHIARGAQAELGAEGGEGRPPVINVPALRLDTLLAESRPDVVIMDVEGAEKTLFDHPWPDNIRSVMMELHPARYPDTVIQKIVARLSAAGMTYDPHPSRGTLLAFRRVQGPRHKRRG